MYAVIFCGGKQHKVCEGQQICVELLHKENDSEVELDKVILISDGTNVKVGAPYLEGAKVTAKVVAAEVPGKKVKIVKFRRRKHHQKVTGHRQWYTKLEITGITG